MVPKTPRPASPPLNDGPGLKTRLIGEARILLEGDGIAALTLRATAREAGVSHMAPYRHFRDKDDLLAAVAEQGFRELTEFIDRAVARHGDSRAGGVAYVSFALENPALYRLMFGAGLASPQQFPGLVAAGAQAFQRCVEASRAKGAGAGDNEEAPDAAIALWSVVHGLASLAADGLVTLPPPGPAREKRIAAILDVAR